MGLRGQLNGNDRQRRQRDPRMTDVYDSTTQARYHAMSRNPSPYPTVWEMPKPLKPPTKRRPSE